MLIVDDDEDDDDDDDGMACCCLGERQKATHFNACWLWYVLMFATVPCHAMPCVLYGLGADECEDE